MKIIALGRGIFRTHEASQRRTLPVTASSSVIPAISEETLHAKPAGSKQSSIKGKVC